jgi:hypothetical protein
MREKGLAKREPSTQEKPALCTCGYCWRRNCSRAQHRSFANAVYFAEPVIQTSRPWLIAKAFPRRAKAMQ